ncbi:MAG: 6-phosphofructokinase [Candidatus Kapabacteria bacterium]|nr:6-phosphofructokinase [Candidatus Kapabacteria bacterium]
MKRIALFTSGGDAPGMNAHIRAVERVGEKRGVEVVGIIGGYSGMIAGHFELLDRIRTANIIDRGGTILKTSRCEDFLSVEGRVRAIEQLRSNGIEGVIACGGDGTFHGAHALWTEHGMPIVGTPGTIDNDLSGTDFTIGYDTAINTAAQAIDKIRDTADSHGRLFFIEVMGRHAGFIAMDVGIACGAEYIAVPETITDIDELYRRIVSQGRERRTVVIVGEGDELGGAMGISKAIEERYGIPSKVSILGHIQRGGSPTVRDRVLASRLGAAAVDALLGGQTDVMIGEVAGSVRMVPLEDTWTTRKPVPGYLKELSTILI